MTRKKTKKRRGNLSGASTRRSSLKKGISVDTIKNESIPVLLIAAGVIAANMAGKAIDSFIKPEGDSFSVKKLAKPIILTGAGLAVKILSDNKMLKDFGTGLSLGGVLSGVKLATKKSMLDNLNGDALAQINPDLPDISGYLESSIDGDLENFEGEVEDVDMEEISGDDEFAGEDDTLYGRGSRGARNANYHPRKALPPTATAPEDMDVEAIDFV